MKKSILCVLFIVCANTYAQDFDKGKELFNTNCAACHNMEKKMTGPALKDIAGKMGREWLEKWIPNSKKLIESGDAEAVRVYAEYNQAAMPSYEYLKKEELSSIIDYLEGYNKKKTEAAAAVQVKTTTTTGVAVAHQSESVPTYIIIILSLVVVIGIVIILVIAKAFSIIGESFKTEKKINSQLMKKLGTTENEVTKEIDEILESEITYRVSQKIKTIKKEIDIKLKDFN